MSLYDLTGELAELQRLAEDGEDVSEALARVEGDLEKKGLGIAHVLRNLEADVTALNAETERLIEKSQRLVRQHKRLGEYVLATMQARGVHAIKGPAFSLKVAENPPKVVVEDESAIPPEYMRTPDPPPPPKAVPDKKAILAAFKEHGEVVPGTRIERGVRLVIK